jgi:uncharacterized protein YdeI (BOF family)
MRITGAILLCLLLTNGCRKPTGTVLGKAPRGEAHSILAVRAGNTPPQVTITGAMVEKCPIAGCWFRLRDRTGVIKVDTKSAGFVVVDVPLESQVTVAGKVVADGDDVMVEATGIRY